MPEPEEKKKPEEKEKPDEKAKFDEDGFDPGNAPEEEKESTETDIPEEYRDPQKSYLKLKEFEKKEKKYKSELEEKDRTLGVAKDYLLKLEADKERLKGQFQESSKKPQSEEFTDEKYNELFYKNPRAANELLYEHKMKPVTDMILQGQEMIAKQEVKSEPEFKKFEQPFEHYWGQLKPEQRNPANAKLIYRFLKAEDLERREKDIEKKEKELKEKEKRGRTAETPPSYSKPSEGGYGEEDNEPMSAEEIRTMRAFGMKEDDWRKRGKQSRGSVIS